MKTVAFINIPAYGHINTTLDMAEFFVKRGDTVLYYATKEFKEHVEKSGARCKLLDDLYKSDYQVPIPFDVLALYSQIVGYTGNVMEPLLADLRAENVTHIVSDSMCTYGQVAASILDLPRMDTNSVMIPNPRDYLHPTTFPEVATFVHPHRLHETYSLVRTLLQLKKRIPISRKNTDVEQVVFTSKYLQGLYRSNKITHFVGPAISHRSKDVSLKTLEKKFNPTKIYIALGTLFNNQRDFYTTCIEAFGDHAEYTLTMSIGHGLQAEDLGAIPTNFSVHQSVDQIAVLQDTDIFITHSGFNSTSEAIIFGVPMLCVPQMCEQHINARRVCKLDGGVYLHPKHVSVASLQSSMNELIQHYKKYQNGIHTIRDTFADTENLDSILETWITK